MKYLTQLSAILLIAALVAVPAIAHHAAEGIVDEEIYAMIDEAIAGTPHADMTIDDLGGGMTETTITTMTVQSMENLFDEGLLTYIAMLDGEVEMSILFDDTMGVILTITQVE